jgi:ribonuclease HI
VEEGAHLFIKCDHVKEVWRGLGLEDVRRELVMSNSVLHALDIVWKAPVETRVLILTLWWLWWCNRNKLREGHKILEAAAVAHQTRCYVAEYMEILGKKEKDKTCEQTTWIAPTEDVLKFNIGGAFTMGHDHAGWGVVARGHRGKVVAANAGRSEHVSDAFHAELSAVVQAVRLAEYLGAVHTVLETDSQLLMSALNRREADVSPLGVIIDELKFQISTTFTSCDTVFCKREFNRPAHELASIGWSCDAQIKLRLSFSKKRRVSKRSNSTARRLYTGKVPELQQFSND